MSEEPSLDLGIEGITNAQHIGSGGAADVYRAEQPRLGRTVAVKVLRANTSTENRARFEREAQTLGRLSNHPGIVTLHEAGLTSIGQPFLMMEFCPAGTLADRTATEGPLSWQEACTIVADVADVVDEAHGSGVLHRDLKPANVLIDSRGKHLVADFGVAALSDTGNYSAAADFTPGYAPPETLRGEAATPEGDVYSLAATAQALITGRVPFESTNTDSNNVLAWIRRIEDEPPLDLRPFGVHDAAASIIERAMSKDPSGRTSAKVFADDLRAAVALGEGAPPTPAGGDPMTTAVSAVLPAKPTTTRPPLPSQPPMPGPDSIPRPDRPPMPTSGINPSSTPTTGHLFDQPPPSPRQPATQQPSPQRPPTEPPSDVPSTVQGHSVEPRTGPVADQTANTDFSGHTTAVPQVLPQKPTSIEIPESPSAIPPMPQGPPTGPVPAVPGSPTTGPRPTETQPNPALPIDQPITGNVNDPTTTGPVAQVPASPLADLPAPDLPAPATPQTPSDPPTEQDGVPEVVVPSEQAPPPLTAPGPPVMPDTGHGLPSTTQAAAVPTESTPSTATPSAPLPTEPATKLTTTGVPPVVPTDPRTDGLTAAPVAEDQESSSRKGVLILLALLALVVLGLGGLLIASLLGGQESAGSTTTAAMPATSTTVEATPAPTTEEPTTTTTTTTTVITNVGEALADISGDGIVLTGVVPDQDTFDALQEAATGVFSSGEIVTDELEIDDSVTEVELELSGSLDSQESIDDLVTALDDVERVDVVDNLTVVTTTVTTSAPRPPTTRSRPPTTPAPTSPPTTAGPGIVTNTTEQGLG